MSSWGSLLLISECTASIIIFSLLWCFEFLKTTTPRCSLYPYFLEFSRAQSMKPTFHPLWEKYSSFWVQILSPIKQIEIKFEKYSFTRCWGDFLAEERFAPVSHWHYGHARWFHKNCNKPYSYSSGITQLPPHLSFPFKVYWAGEVYFESISSQNTEIMRTLVIIVSFSPCEEKGQKSNNIHMKTMIK